MFVVHSYNQRFFAKKRLLIVFAGRGQGVTLGRSVRLLVRAARDYPVQAGF